jgi:CheY-like chemotaxis protein
MHSVLSIRFRSSSQRNPLSSAIAALSFVNSTAREKVEDKEIREALLDDIAILDSSLQYINDLLRNMLDIHRTASRKMKIDESLMDIRKDIFEPVKAILCVKHDKAKILIDCPEQLVVTADRLRMKEVVLNLAINSSKFVEEGFIRLKAQVIDGQVQISVEDSGPGIRPEQHDRLFAKFQESFDLLSQGTGIGLYICKSLCELMGADLYLDDDYHSRYSNGTIKDFPGARFVIDLHKETQQDPAIGIVQDDVNSPCREKKDEESTYSSSSESSSPPPCQLNCAHESLSASQGFTGALPESLSVLFVDDDFILRKLFARTVKRAAPTWNVHEASNGETALTLVDTNSYDLIFMDQYMASVDKQLLGTETTSALRQKGVSCIICGLSANDMKDQFMERGADSFVLKPFPCEMEKLQRELWHVLQSRKHVENEMQTA